MKLRADKISVSEMLMAINTFARKEIKFLLNMDQYHGLMEVIDQYMNPDKFCVGGKEYGIYNIYYDTPDDYLIRESLAKPYYKEKIRLRSYYSPAAPDDMVFLEIKKKIGGIVTKRRVQMTLAESDAYFRDRSKPECTKYITEQVFRELEAFFGKYDSDFRLTFDRKITERRYDLGLNYESYGNYIIGADQRLMEVKVSNAIPDWLVNKLSELEIYKTSFSKYGRAYQNFIKSQVESMGRTNGGRRIYVSGISMVNNSIMNRSV